MPRPCAPQRRLDLLMLVQKAQLHRIGSVVQHDDLIEVLAHHAHKIALRMAETQIMIVLGELLIVLGIAVDIGFAHVGRQIVGSFAGPSCQRDYSHVRIRFRLLQQGIRVGGYRRLRQGPALLLNGHFGTIGRVRSIEFRQTRIDGESRMLEALAQRNHLIILIDAARASTRIRGILRRPTKEIQFFDTLQRQCVIVILQQNKTFFGNPFCHLLRILGSGFAHRARSHGQTDECRHRTKANQTGHGHNRSHHANERTTPYQLSRRLRNPVAGNRHHKTDGQQDTQSHQIPFACLEHTNDIFHIDADHILLLCIIAAVQPLY